MSVQPSTLRWEVCREGTMARFSFAGEMDASSIPIFESALAGEDDAEIVVLDLTDVVFIDSSGLRALLRARTEVEGRGGGLFVGAVSAPVERILAVTGLDRYMEGALPPGRRSRRGGPRRRPWA